MAPTSVLLLASYLSFSLFGTTLGTPTPSPLGPDRRDSGPVRNIHDYCPVAFHRQDPLQGPVYVTGCFINRGNPDDFKFSMINLNYCATNVNGTFSTQSPGEGFNFGWAMNTCVCHHTSVALANLVLICSCQVPGSKEIKTTSSDMAGVMWVNSDGLIGCHHNKGIFW